MFFFVISTNLFWNNFFIAWTKMNKFILVGLSSRQGYLWNLCIGQSFRLGRFYRLAWIRRTFRFGTWWNPSSWIGRSFVGLGTSFWIVEGLRKRGRSYLLWFGWTRLDLRCWFERPNRLVYHNNALEKKFFKKLSKNKKIVKSWFRNLFW